MVDILAMSSVNMMAENKGPMMPSDSTITVMNVAAESDPSMNRKQPTGSTPSSTLGHTLIMMAVHGSVVRDQSIMSPEFAFTASVNLA